MKTNILERPRYSSTNRDQLLQSIRQTFAALDFAEENAQVAELKADIRKMQDSVVKAEARCTEISRELVENRGHDGKAIADALLADASAQAAASLGPSREDMENERAALSACSRLVPSITATSRGGVERWRAKRGALHP